MTLAASGFTALAVLGMATRGCPGSRHRSWGYLSTKLLSTGAVSGAECTWVGKTHPSSHPHPQHTKMGILGMVGGLRRYRDRRVGVVSEGRGPGAALDSYTAEEAFQFPPRGSGVVWKTAKKALGCLPSLAP